MVEVARNHVEEVILCIEVHLLVAIFVICEMLDVDNYSILVYVS